MDSMQARAMRLSFAAHVFGAWEARWDRHEVHSNLKLDDCDLPATVSNVVCRRLQLLLTAGNLDWRNATGLPLPND